MAQLRAKQIKLAAAGDLLIGGTNGNGSVLSKGGDGQVLKIIAGGLAYADNTANDIVFSDSSFTATNVSAALIEAKALAKKSGDDLAAEVTRATTAEGTLTTNLAAEVTRATDAEGVLQDNIDTVSGDLADEIARATGAEGTLTTNLAAEILRATGVEDDLQDQIDLLSAGSTEITDALQAELDFVEAAVGLGTDGKLVAFAGNYTTGKTTFKAAVDAIDTQVKTNSDNIGTLQGQVSALSGLGALHFQGELAGDTDDATLATAGAAGNAPATGDVFRIITTGAEDFAETGLEVNVGDFVVKTATGWVKFDNTDPTVAAANGETAIVIGGDAHSGYTVALTKGDLTSGSTAITLTGGTDAILADVTLGFDPSKVNFSDLAQVGTPEAGKYLKWTGTGLAYVSAAELGATVAVDEDFTPAAAANVSFDLTSAPVGGIAVFMNGVKLKKTGYTVVGSTITLVDSVNGYAYEAGDTLSASYNTAA